MADSSSTTTTTKIGDTRPIEQQRRDWFAQITLRHLHAFALFAFAAFISFSIAGAHVSLGLLTLCVIVQRAKRRGQSAEGGEPRSEGKISSPNSSIRLGIEWPIIAFASIALTSTVLSETPLTSLYNLRHLLTILGAYAVALSLRQFPEWRRPLLWTFISVATLAALYGLGKYAFGYSSKVQSTQSTTMTWGALCVMFMAVTLQIAITMPNRRERWLAWGAIIPQAFAMLLSLVRGAYVGLTASAVYLFRKYWASPRLLWRRVLPALLGLAVVLVFLSPEVVRQRLALIFDLKYHSTQVRLVQWKYALKIAADHPLVGIGWRDVLPVFRHYAPPDIAVPEAVKYDIFHIGHFHNNYVMVLVCFGVPGLLAFLWLLAAVWRQLGVTAKHTRTEPDRLMVFASRAAMVGFLVAGIFDWTFGDAEVVTMLWFVMGLGFGQSRSADFKPPLFSRDPSALDISKPLASLPEITPGNSAKTARQ